jgi:hypothetical protein
LIGLAFVGGGFVGGRGLRRRMPRLGRAFTYGAHSLARWLGGGVAVVESVRFVAFEDPSAWAIVFAVSVGLIGLCLLLSGALTVYVAIAGRDDESPAESAR